MKFIEYNNRYEENVKDLLVELEKYIISIDEDNLDNISDDYREKYFLKTLNEINENNGKMYLAIENNKAIGLVAGIIYKYSDDDYLDYKCPKKGIVTELIISKNYQKGGLGKTLLHKIENYFREQECEYIILDVFAYNKNAIDFYKRNNYHTRMETLIKKI